MRIWTVLIVLLVSMQVALAADTPPVPASGPKPLTAETPPSSTPAQPQRLIRGLPPGYKDPNAIPDEYIELRRQAKADYNAWRAADNQIQQECAAPQTPVQKAACDQKQRMSQARLDKVHAEMRDMQKKIDTWRNKKRGLPPPSWYPENQPVKTQNPDGKPKTTTGKDETILLPPPSKALLPANTY